MKKPNLSERSDKIRAKFFLNTYHELLVKSMVKAVSRQF